MHSSPRLRVMLLAALLVVSAISPVAVAAATPTTTVLQSTPSDPEVGDFVCFDVTTTITAGGGWVAKGQVSVYETTSGADVYVGGEGYGFGQPSTGGFCVDTGFPVGGHSFRADYVDTSSSPTYDPSMDTVIINVDKATPEWDLGTNPASPEAGNPVQISAGFADNGIDEQGSVAIYRSGIANPICSTGLTNSDSILCTVTAWAPGTYQLTARNSGSASVAASTSAPVTIVVTPNTVHASSVGTQYTTFYPITDAYRDTVAIKGVRGEPSSVTIRIYTPGGTLIKTQAIAMGSGAYSYAWKGRTSTGAIRAEGKYRVTQVLKDSLGTTRTYTHYVTLSKKKIYTYTKTITKMGSTVAAKGKSGTGSITLNTTSGTALVKSGSSGWAGVGYDFTLPTVTIYKSIKFRVQSKSGLAPWNVIGMQNFSTCPYTTSTSWYERCFDKWESVGNSANTAAYFTSTGSITTNRSGVHARGMLSVPGGTVTVYRAQIVLVYGVLKY